MSELIDSAIVRRPLGKRDFIMTYNGNPILPEGSSMTIMGRTGTMKSFITAGMLASIENPEADSFGFKINLRDGRKALYISTEGGDDSYIKASSLVRRIWDEDVRRVEFWDFCGYYGDCTEALIDKVRYEDYGLVVINNVRDFAHEYTGTEVSEIIRKLRVMMTQRNVTLITTHYDELDDFYEPLMNMSSVSLKITLDNKTGVGCITDNFEGGKLRYLPPKSVHTRFKWDDLKEMPISIGRD